MRNLSVFLTAISIISLVELVLRVYIPINQPKISDTKLSQYSKSSSFLHGKFSYEKLYNIPPLLPEVEPEPCPTCKHIISNPKKAKEYLTQLDAYIEIEESAFNNENEILSLYNKTVGGLIRDPTYCEKHRNYFIYNTSTFFEERLVFGLYIRNKHVLQDLLPQIATNLNDRVIEYPQSIEKIRPLSHEASFLLFEFDPTENYRVNQEYSCTTQYLNHVIGTGLITRKDLVAVNMNKYIQSYKDRKHCDDFSQFFIKTWHMVDKYQCEDFFFNHFNTEEYHRLKKERTIVYIRKTGQGAHIGQGVQPVNEEEENELRHMFDDGRACDLPQKNYVIQKYIHNSLLLQGHKFDLRSYLLIASTNPLIAYYADGFLRVSLFKYDPKSDNKAALLTNSASVNYVFDEARKGNLITGMTEQELKDFQYWDYHRLANYLKEIGKIQNRDNWLEYLRSQMKKAMVHLLRMSKESIVVRSSMFELFGLDFILDENLDLYFLECNAEPMMQGVIERKKEFFIELNKDLLDLMYGYLRSRLKRLVKFINKTTEESPNELDHRRRRNVQFKKMTSNYMDPEFAVKSKYFTKILDMNQARSDRYYSVEDDCI